MLLAASFLAVVEMGGEAPSLQITADKAFYTGKDIERVVRKMWDENMLFDNKPNANGKFENLTDNYRAATGLLVDITPTWMLWTRYEDKESHAGTQYSKIARISPDNWLYYFESYQIIWDYDDIVLCVSKTDENLEITIVDFDPVKDLPIDVYYGSTLLWDDATSANVGESKTVAGTTQLTVSFNVRDPRGAARYSSLLQLG
jgi:hypothetical protein